MRHFIADNAGIFQPLDRVETKMLGYDEKFDKVFKVLEKKIAHGGNEVLRWMMDNVFVRTDPAENIKMDKEKSTEKIDGAVALVMALDRGIRHGGVQSRSVYDEMGLMSI